MKDDKQRRAGVNILRFLAAVLIFTLVARGTAGATLASVSTALPSSGEVVEQVRATGNVKAAGNYPMQAPEGLTVDEILVTGGQRIESGEPVARFNLEDLDEKIRRERAALNDLQVKLQLLERGETHDSSAVETAQRLLNEARQDYDLGKAAGEKAVADAQNALAAAQQPAENEGTVAGTAPGVSEAQAALEEAGAALAADLLRLSRAVEAAEQSLAQAQRADADARQTETDAATQNSAEAQTVRLDIEAQGKKLDELEKLRAAEGLFISEGSGTVMVVNKPAGKTDGGTLMEITDGTQGFIAEALITREEAEKLQPGSSCEVSTGGGSMYYNPTVTGSIRSISEPSESGQVTVQIQLPEGNWKQGQSVDARILINKQSYNTCIPLSALHSSNTSYYVYILETRTGVLGTENVVVGVPVNLMAKDENTAAVEGLEYDVKIIVSSSKPLSEGDKVRLKEV